METAYSLSDLASVMNNENGWGGNSAWLIILFVLIFGWGGNGFNKQGELGTYASNSQAQDILFTQKFDAIGQKINSIGDGLCSSTYALNNAIVNEGRTLGNAINSGFSNIQNCCCDLKYDIANQFANANANTTAQTQKILDALAQNKIDSLQAQVSELKTQNMFCGIPRISNYAYGVYPYATQGCGCGMNSI